MKNRVCTFYNLYNLYNVRKRNHTCYGTKVTRVLQSCWRRIDSCLLDDITKSVQFYEIKSILIKCCNILPTSTGPVHIQETSQLAINTNINTPNNSTNTNPKKKIHQHKTTGTIPSDKPQKHKATNTNSAIQIKQHETNSTMPSNKTHRHKDTNTNPQIQLHQNKTMGTI